MRKNLIDIDGSWLVDARRRQTILRGVNLGGDSKVPYSDSAAHRANDFSDHRTVSFVGRPFPLADADAHFGRITSWGFNVLRLLVTWEAIEHAAPGTHDVAYLDYIAALVRRAAAHNLLVIIDFHQDVWSRMSGGDGAPGWTFDAMGLDFTRFDAADAAHVMQYRYDYASPVARQEDRYPRMSWARNYRMPANGIAWTAFFAGSLLTPGWTVGGENIQHFLQRHYLGAMAALAERVADIDEVIGFDTLNEPSPGWIGQMMSEPQLTASAESPIPVRPGICWTPFTALCAASGLPVVLPVLAPAAGGAMQIVGSRTANPNGVPIWRQGVSCPFAEAGAWTVKKGVPRVLDEDFFRRTGGREIDSGRDLMRPFFHAVADTIRAARPGWLLFAEVNPYQFGHGRGFPEGMPERTVNASHWYDVAILLEKRFNAHTDRAALQKCYRDELSAIHATGRLNGCNAPTLVGEFGIPYDLNDGCAYARWAAGERSEDIWQDHAVALDLMYGAMDELLLSSTQWNYTASNRNDLRVGDGWNQEDLSIFSLDQLDGGADGARGLLGFSRPYVRHAQGRLLSMRFDMETGVFEASLDADPMIDAPTEIFLPPAHYPCGVAVHLSDREATFWFDPDDRRVLVQASSRGPLSISLGREGASQVQRIARLTSAST